MSVPTAVDAEPARQPVVRRVPCHAVVGWRARMRGLLGHPQPPAGTGWWFARCAAVHTVGMRYAIDVVFLDRQARVLAVVCMLRPGRACWRLRACQVIELAGGEAARLGLVPGMSVHIVVTSSSRAR